MLALILVFTLGRYKIVNQAYTCDYGRGSGKLPLLHNINFLVRLLILAFRSYSPILGYLGLATWSKKKFP